MDPYLNMHPNMDYEEVKLLESVLSNLSDEDKQKFMMIYRGRRQDANNILMFTLIGFLGFAGIQRFLTGNVALGIIYFLTLGLCQIGTIVDAVNYKSITLNHNRQKMLEVAQMMGIQVQVM